MSLYQQILSALVNAPVQTDRLLRLHTPLGANVLVAERLTAVEAIGPAPVSAVADTTAPSTGLRLTVHALAADTHIELKSLIGQPALVELLTQSSRSELRPFHGHITHVALVGSDGGLARYRLVIEPWLAFLGHRQDSWVFQRQTVQQIVDEVFADYAGQGKLAPAWRWDLADPAVYPERSLCIQYQETDLAFIQRLLLEEGLFHWWEHSGDANADTLGTHTLVIADHNGAAPANAQSRVRYTQSGASLSADSLTRWRSQRNVRSAQFNLASPDHRSLSLRPVSQFAAAQSGAAPLPELTQTDIPGAYAYEDLAQGERLALRRMQALDAQRHRALASGTWRTAAPGTTFTLADHPVHSGLDEQRDRFVLLAVQHDARNNLRADHAAQVGSLLGAIARSVTGGTEAEMPNDSAEPVYQCRLVVQPAAVPLRMAEADVPSGSAQSGALTDALPDPRLHPRPTVHGVQTALVVGLGEPLHTDRDHRIKIQFHWQRGANGSHRQPHPAGDNAPASDASGTWVRVAQTVAGANWGAVFTPRLGQEVLVSFVQGDIDRPVVVGSVYNGQGQADAQNNQISGGAAGAVGNAPAWFPGAAAQGDLQSHRHPAVLAGYKSQELASSARGTGGHNQLVLDDSPGAHRIELSSTSAQTRLQLGHLLHQVDNQRLQPRGHGLDLATAAWGAVRAGSGLLLSAHGKASSTARALQLDSREPSAQAEQGQDLLHSLAESAQQHQAKGSTEPDVVGATRKDTARQLPNEQALYATLISLAGTDARGDDSGAGDSQAIGGGQGTVTAWTRPDLVLAAPGGVGTFTPASTVLSAGHTATLVAAQDVQHLAQRHLAVAARSGLVFYTYGKASNSSKPNTETGIKLHAASGNVNTQSQSAATKLTADKRVEVSSTTAMVKIAAPKHVLLTAAGAAIRLEGGDITLNGPGAIEFRASMKELAGAGGASASLSLKKPGPLAECEWKT